MNEEAGTHPSLGKPLRWVVVDEAGASLIPGLPTVERIDIAAADAVVLDTMSASYLGPGVRPRPHAVVVRVDPKRRGDYPPLVVVTPSYASERASRPSGEEMIRNEGRLVGDAIAVARCAGLVVDALVIERRHIDAYARNEGLDASRVLEVFIDAAQRAAKSTLPRDR